MQLNHINLPVKDVALTRGFFETYFQFTTTGTKGNDMLSVLKGPGDFTLVLMAEDFNRHGHSVYPDAFHIGFLVETRERVMEIFDSLREGGIVLENQPARMRSVFGFYFTAPGNLLTEVSCALT